MALAADYSEAARRLSPPGPIWQSDDWIALCEALGESLVVTDGALAALLDEFDPATADQLLAALERVYGLPEDCLSPPTTEDDRRAALAAKMRGWSSDGREATIIGMALRSGYTITLTTYQAAVYGVAVAGDLFYDEDWAFHIDIPEASIPGWLQCLIRKAIPAHVSLSFSGS